MRRRQYINFPLSFLAEVEAKMLKVSGRTEPKEKKEIHIITIYNKFGFKTLVQKKLKLLIQKNNYKRNFETLRDDREEKFRKQRKNSIFVI